jgi:hypothetical protein
MQSLLGGTDGHGMPCPYSNAIAARESDNGGQREILDGGEETMNDER